MHNNKIEPLKNNPTAPSLSDRMKEYENVFSGNFTRRTPLIIRLDGKAFHTWTRSLNRPFDPILPKIFSECLKELVANIQCCQFAYAQSDEISLFLRDYDKVNTEAWYGANQQKIVSVSSSILTAKFNQLSAIMVPGSSMALFDARAFVLPKDEVANYFIFRQNDAIRNSIQGQAQKVLGHKNCQGKGVSELKQAIIEKSPDDDWENLDTCFQRGIAFTRAMDEVDFKIPLFKENRNYIEELVYIKND